MISIDINADLGESFGAWRMGDDEAMLSIVTSANIACGFHAGDPLQMSRTVELALKNNVAIGAHPGFNDLQGFGRRRILGMAPRQLAADLLYQIGALQAIARSKGARVSHVKLHGALANMASEDFDLAQTCVRAIADLDKSLAIVVMPNTALARAAKADNHPVICEIYADRAYNDDATLVSRHREGAMIEDPQQAADRMIKVLESGELVSINGKKIPLEAQTICVHGDNPHAVKMAKTILDRLERSGIRIARNQS